MQTHKLKLQPEPFEKIKNETKKIELRLYDEKRKNINLGDIIEFYKEPEKKEKIKTEVTALLRYKSFSDLFDDFSPDIFGGKTKEQLLEGVHKFYSPNRERENSVLGIKIKLLAK